MWAEIFLSGTDVRSRIGAENHEMIPKKILFVCLGNICRSPAAEEIMRQKIKQAGLEGMVQVDSAGTYGGHTGCRPDTRMREAAAGRGYDLTTRARQLGSSDFENFDMIVVMDDSNFERVQHLAPAWEDAQKVFRMTDFIRGFDVDHIPDPYYEGRRGFEHVLDLLEDACEGLLDAVRSDPSRIEEQRDAV